MSAERPAVSVVMPFAGDGADARQALVALRRLRLAPGDELILADNVGIVPPADDIRVVRADGERSPARARNAGAEAARGEWILFLDADTTAPANLIDAYFATPVSGDVGALAGEIGPAENRGGIAVRYAAARNFLSAAAHMAHPYLPRAAAANLLVRRSAFAALGGFYEGVRAAEDTDFTWRLQRAGWRLELRSGAAVEHRYRTAVGALRRQWRGYAAGRAWLRRRYPGFVPEPAIIRALRRVLGRGWARSRAPRPSPDTEASPAPEPLIHRVLDLLLAAEELVGFASSNRPAGRHSDPSVELVLVADRFPAREDPLVEQAFRLGRVRVEAAARPVAVWTEPARRLEIAYREDDGAGARLWATARLLVRHPSRVLRDRRGAGPRLSELAPAAARLEQAARARVVALGSDPAVRAAAERLGALAGRPLGEV